MFSQNHYRISAQAKAVKAYLESYDGVEATWDGNAYADVSIAPWFNGRERGYVLSMSKNGRDLKQLNIAFYENRNSDNICVLAWEQWSMNPLTIDTAIFPDGYHGSIEYFGYGKAREVAEDIYERLTEFWEKD